MDDRAHVGDTGVRRNARAGLEDREEDRRRPARDPTQWQALDQRGRFRCTGAGGLVAAAKALAKKVPFSEARS